MRNKTFVLLVMFFLVVACQRGKTPGTQEHAEQAESPVQQAFFERLASLCGESFQGTQIYRSPHGQSWEAQEMVIQVEECREDHIHIPFRVGEDTSRTWIFLIEEGKLRFQHDHRHADGTPEEASLYGGFANESGTAFVQYFPADDYTAEVIPGGEGNVWTLAFDQDMTTLSYILQRNGELRLRVDFDLSNPL